MNFRNTLFLAVAITLFAMPSFQSMSQDNPCGIEGVVVEASNFLYSPEVVQIDQGETVVWVNLGGFHDVNGAQSTLGDNWDNPETFYINPVSSGTDGACIGAHTFTVAGVYEYDCSIGAHAQAGMVGQVIVNESNPTQITESPQRSNISIHPNPSSGGLILVQSDWSTDAVLRCFDLRGRVQDELRLMEGDNWIDVSDWKAGMYTAVITSNDRRETHKFIVK
ncbi:MAG TPA: hypothetical protein DCS71_00545 [Flavobacteriales bacterium]|nr:hypothetical protein [Flavobacteriales bacterium]